MKEKFGNLPNGEIASLYTISRGALRAQISDLGATLVRLFVPDRSGAPADVVLGYDSPAEYLAGTCYFGATIGRNANRIGNATFVLNGKTYAMPANEGPNNLHSGPDGYELRLWEVIRHTENTLDLGLHSPHNDQGLPGNADIRVSYIMEQDGLRIVYSAVSDRDTIFNMTNHSYFNLRGHNHPEAAMEQVLSMPARCFQLTDAAGTPTGEMQAVAGTPMDFRVPKPLGQDLEADYTPLALRGGYDHNYEVFCNPCATLSDPVSGRTMSVYTDCPGVQLYTGNYTDETGKGGQRYPRRSGVCLETQFYPDANHNPQWPQPICPAGKKYFSETKYAFHW